MGFDISKFASTMPSTRPRTIETVTEEILDIKQRVTEDFMELGQRLCEAKELLPHGEWLPWLEGRVQFSERTAQKFMQLAREYEANPKLASDLGSEKAFALLALPKEEREQIAREGMIVDGKTKPAADLTKREIQQAVRERKVVAGVDLGKGKDWTADALEYLRERAEENERFESLLYRYRKEFLKALSVCDTRQDGIFVLKERFKYSSSGSNAGGWSGQSKGLGLHGGDFHCIERTWTEVWDMLAVMALQEVGRKSAEVSEGQLAIAGWMPGGTNPGKESGLCVCMMPIDPEKPSPMIMYWDGVLGRWTFPNKGAEIEMQPVGWMRLPEWRK